MRGRYFRYIFQNEEGSLFHIGSIYNKEKQNVTNCIYLVGNYNRYAGARQDPKAYNGCSVIPEVIDILVLGGCTVGDISKLIYITKKHRVKTIILPYLTPIQRLVLMEDISEKSILAKEINHFLKEPYLFLKKADIGQIYFLYGNDEPVIRNPEELEPGIHFAPVSLEERKIIQMMEGRPIPVMQAGYIVENGWLFYFGMYGMGSHVLSDFTRHYFSHLENICEASENIDEDYTEQTRRLIQEYYRKFGNCPATTVVMFEGALHASPEENESFMTQKEIGGLEACRGWVSRKDTGCTIRCMYGRDYDVMQNCKSSVVQEGKFGILMLGNANLNRYYPEIAERFYPIRTWTRGVCVPNCGSGEDWNYEIINLFAVEGRLYWICNKYDTTSVGMIGDIVLTSSQNRFLMLDKSCICCFSGYIIPKEDLE